MTAATAPAPAPVMSGHCGISRHQQCRGLYAGHPCPCDCHSEPEPEPEPVVHVEPRRVQIRRGEVWRTDPDGSWRAIGIVERGDHPTLDGAVTELLAGLGVDTGEYQP